MRKRRSDGLGVGRKAKRPRRHLYVVMDDGEGYAVRKFDLSSHRDTSDDEAEQLLEQRTAGVVEQRLPRALISLDSPTGEYFAAIGTKIMVTHDSWPDRAVPVFDVRTRRLSLGPPPRACRNPRYPTYLPLGDKLVSVDAGSTELLDPPPPKGSDVEWSWHKLPRRPFSCIAVASYAAHPDGRTVFFSVETRDDSASTFALDTESEVWRRLGEWRLPFFQQAHFDPELDAWVGLAGSRDTFGYLCSSDVPPLCADTSNQPPAWKLGKEKLFCQDPAEENCGATLAYMGRTKAGNRVGFDEEYKDIEVEDEEDRPRRHLLRLTSFSLKYDKHGDLQTSTYRQVRCYKLPHVEGTPLPNDVQAFWM
ncbi:hypothetical protein ACQ4PT_028878 [Festuca glaucescens]